MARKSNINLSFLLSIEKVMKSGEEFYIAMVSEPKGVELKLEDISVVRRFSDIFLEELLGMMIPDRQVQFEINLVSSAVPI